MVYLSIHGSYTRAGSKVMRPMMLNDNIRWDCFFVYFKFSKYHTFTDTQIFQTFNPILEDFLTSFWGIPLRRFNLRHLTFGGRYISASMIFLETRDDKKCTGG